MKWPFLDHPVPFGFAHQGGTDVAPGNTEAAFQHAVSLGYRYIETDVQATSDGVLVVFHDDDLEDATGIDGSISDMTWAQVSELRIGREHPIPRFEDMLERFPETRFNVEPKSDRALEPFAELVRKRDLFDRICVGSFSDRRMARLRSLLGPKACASPGPLGVLRVVIRALLGSTGNPDEWAALQIPPSKFGIPLTTRWLVSRVQRMGIQVHVWTINEEAQMRRLLDAGVDAIMTDEVTLLRDVLRSRDQWPESS